MYNDKDLKILADLIKKNIQEDFENIHLTGQLMNTIKITRTTMGFEIDIPAELYDLSIWYDKKVIVHTNNGSYAQIVNEDGGFSGEHINYVERSITKAINEWLVKMKRKARVNFE